MAAISVTRTSSIAILRSILPRGIIHPTSLVPYFYISSLPWRSLFDLESSRLLSLGYRLFSSQIRFLSRLVFS
jgi:hypothetical protein